MSTSGGSRGSTSPLTTKGDLWGYSTVNARVAVGSDTQVLTADSTQALGIKWAAVAGLPAGGSVGQAVINTAPATGTWQGDTAWTAPTLQNSWAQVAGWTTPGFRKDALGFVHIRGRMNGGNSNTVCFTLPAGDRPGGGTNLFSLTATDSSDAILGAAYCFIQSTGTVTMIFGSAGGTTRLDLTGITFYAEN